MNYCSIDATKKKADGLTLDDLFKFSIIFYLFSIFFSISSAEILVKLSRVFVFGVWFINFIININENKKVGFNWYYIWAALFLIYHACLIVFGKVIDSSTSLTFLTTVFYTLIINCIILSYLKKHNDFFLVIIKVLPLVALLGMLRVYLTYGFTYYFNSRGDEVNGNGTGFKGAIGVLCAFYILIINHKRRKLTKNDFIFGAILLLDLALAILTASRKVFIFLGIAVVFYLIFRSKNVLKLLRNIAIAIILLIAIWFVLIEIPFLYNLVGNRIESMLAGFLGQSTDASTDTRLHLIEWGMEFFEKSKLFGYGLDGFRSMMKITHPGHEAYYAHNNFVEMLVAGGIVGFILYYLLYLIVIVKGLKLLKTKDKTILYFFGIFIGLLVCEYGMVTYYETVSQLIIMLCFYVFFTKEKKANTKSIQL